MTFPEPFEPAPSSLVLAKTANLAITKQSQGRTSPQTAETTQQFLRLHLLPETLLALPVKQITEVLKVALTEIVPIPRMPEYVMGVHNWRGEVLWIIDLGCLLGLQPLFQQPVSQLIRTTVVIHSQGKTLGVSVQQVEGMEWWDSNLIQPSSRVTSTPKLQQFLQGYLLKPSGEMLAVLDGNLIMAGLPKPEV
ncbi:chemotaxis protein CheW [Leptolyngbya sp. FACHB-261]|uniref:chemotaxis protein CheW n=1 Tax=Leptolyngbya sp. FACHB-261 TaxID=2692806 RepID=UPI001689B13E|nr:chemotaxis protein CheW [Leptolyngbya sp. FACHB-261]MBD2102870.1 chemotaxis protein CheW [Leptolyngbya sp. FACHB-261]